MKKLKSVIIAIVLFFFIYEIRIKGLPAVFSSRKVTFVLMIILSMTEYRRGGVVLRIGRLRYGAGLIYKQYFLYMMIVWGYSFFLAVANNRLDEGYVDAKFLSFYLMYSVLTPYFLCAVFSDIEDLFRILSVIGVIQATVVYMLSVSYDLRVLFDNFLETETKLTYSAQAVKVYGLGAWGANGSVLMFLSLYAIGYFLLKGRRMFLYILMYAYILAASVMVGRTGFYLGIGLAVFLGFGSLRKKVKKTVVLSLAASFIVLVLMLVIGLKAVSDNRNIYERAMITINHLDKSTIFDRDGPSFVNSMMNMTFPDFSLELLYGAGHGRGISRTGMDVQNDIGYVQRIYSLGIIMALMLYAVIFSSFIRIGKRILEKNDRRYYYVLIIVLFVLEVKEQFVFYYIVPAIILTMGLVHIKNQCKEDNDCRERSQSHIVWPVYVKQR